MHTNGRARPAGDRAPWSAVDPGQPTVGQQHVSRTGSWCRAASEALRATYRPPDRRIQRARPSDRATVEQVRAEKERELVAQQAVVGADDPERPALALRTEQLPVRDGGIEQRDMATSREPEVAQCVDVATEGLVVLDRRTIDTGDRDVVPERPGMSGRCMSGRCGRVTQQQSPAEQFTRSVRPGGRWEVQAAGSAS